MSSRDAHLLLVDDDPSAIQAMSRMLAHYPNQRFATSGEVALRLAREGTPDLIVLDAHMPGMSGFALCKALKSDPMLARVPVIFATSDNTASVEVAALRQGAADFVGKPLVAPKLVARVRVQLRAKSQLEDLARRRPANGAALRPPSPQTPRLLIVDDDVSAIRILRHTLAGMGEFHFARSGEEAMQLAARLHPHMVLLDVHMAETDGFAVCASLKSQAAFEHVPIVFVTRFSDPRNEKRALDLGAADFIAKPYTATVVQARIRNLLDRVERNLAESRLRGDAETAHRAQAMMMSYLAHEIGNPLNGLLGFAQLMAADVDHPLEAEQTRRLGHIVASGRQLQRLMCDVADLGRCEIGQLKLEMRPVEALGCVERATAAVSALAQQAGVHLSCSPVASTIQLAADPDRLHQCLVNLLSNAVKYGRSGGWARIEVSCDAESVAIAVRDNGIGMDALQRRHLFEPFNRLGQPAATPGTGLGLVITRQLVQAMNGRLEVHSVPRAGSCFTIVLPLASHPILLAPSTP